MSVSYNIKSIPTFYKGRRYRSRLEARWAAFFELLMWKDVEYEPCDLGKWSPDFAIVNREVTVLTEVKPISRWDEDVAEKISFSIRDTDKVGMLIGNGPWFSNGLCLIGWAARWGRHGLSWSEICIAECEDGSFTMCPTVPWWVLPSEACFAAPGVYSKPIRTIRDANTRWTEAANAVQWRGKDA